MGATLWHVAAKDWPLSWPKCPIRSRTLTAAKLAPFWQTLPAKRAPLPGPFGRLSLPLLPLSVSLRCVCLPLRQICAPRNLIQLKSDLANLRGSLQATGESAKSHFLFALGSCSPLGVNICTLPFASASCLPFSTSPFSSSSTAGNFQPRRH